MDVVTSPHCPVLGHLQIPLEFAMVLRHFTILVAFASVLCIPLL